MPSFLASANIFFVVIWLLVILLHSMRVLSINVGFNMPILMLIMVNILTAISMSIWEGRVRIGYVDLIKTKLNAHMSSYWTYLSKLMWLYAALSFVDVLYSGGVPFVWALNGSQLNYTDYGVPTLHGLANGLVFFVITSLFLLTILDVKKCWLHIGVIMAFQILIVSRGVIMVSVAQMLCIYFLFARRSFAKMLMLTAVLFLLVVVFGLIGDFRQGSNPYLSFVNDDWFEVFDFLPSGVLWVYVYVESGFNNLLFNESIIEPQYTPVFSFAKLLPTVIYSLLGLEKVIDNFEFVNAGLNVSTIYSGFYSDFGFFSFIFIFLLQFLSAYFLKKIYGGSIYSIFVYAVFYQAVFFSFFIDTLLYLPFLIQIFFAYKLKGVFYER